MMWYWGSGYGWGMTVVGILMTLLMWGGIIALVVLIAGYLGRSRGVQADGAMQALRRRLAAGEISVEEFERLRKALSA